jgi:predicted house-cleaning noncanonical NTP pyrophosphatase (MazG superfamily)
MATIPVSLTSSQDVANQLSEDIQRFISKELEDQLGDFLNIIEDMLNKQTAVIRSTIQSLLDDSESQWGHNRGPITKGIIGKPC